MASRRRFALPAVLAGAIAVGAAVPALAAGSRPNLATVTPQRLVEQVLSDHTTALSGVVTWTPDLGLPSLSALTGGQGVPSAGAFDPTTLLTTAQSFHVWIDGSEERIQAPSSLAETDIVRDGSRISLWDSSTQHVTNVVIPPGPAGGNAPAFDPTTLASQIVSHLEGAGTTVTVGAPVDVYGIPCQVLQLAPADPSTSTVTAVDIAVDAATGTPLQVTINAAGQATPALQVGFSSVTLAPPEPSVFAVPSGSSSSIDVLTPAGLQPAKFGWYGYAPLTQATSPAAPPAPAAPAALESFGSGWSTVVELSHVSLPPGVTTAVPQGRLLRTALVDALVLPDGHALVGFVPPAVLEADAG